MSETLVAPLRGDEVAGCPSELLCVGNEGSIDPPTPYSDIKHLSDYKEIDVRTNLRERYNSFPRVTVAIGICMGMVGFQWMVQQLEEETGEAGSGGGMCYVNTKCSYHKNAMKRGAVPGHNGNQVLSNLVYVVVGLLVSVYACCARESDAQIAFRKERGYYSARYRGMYINAGISLIVEGGLSGLYHICPTPWNNQFDYVGITMVSLSLFLMLWSKRHPLIISVGTWATFLACIFVLCSLAALDAKHDHPVMCLLVWFLCILFYFLLMPRLFLMLHYGIPFLYPEPAEDYGLLACWDALTRMSTFRFFLGMWLLGLAWFPFCCYKEVMLTSAIMKYSCGFLGAYMLFYIWNEFLEQRARRAGYSAVDGDEPGPPGDEKDETLQWAKVLVVATLAAIFMAVGIYFFKHDVYDTTKSRKGSEELNQPCKLLGYFDNHDIWHLCSGTALGGVIVVSMMLDDFNKCRCRSELKVF